MRAIGLSVGRVEPDDLVTMSELAERLCLGIEALRLLTSGRRGDGSFPSPVLRTTSRGHLWSWAQVSRWDDRPDEEIERAEWIAAINARIQVSRFDSDAEQAMIAELTEALMREFAESSLTAASHKEALRCWPEPTDAGLRVKHPQLRAIGPLRSSASGKCTLSAISRA